MADATRAGVVLAPMRVEHAALRGTVAADRLHRSGYGARRSAATMAGLGPRPVVVAGVGGGLTDRTRPGDVVVATEVRDAAAGTVTRLPSAALLAGLLRRFGLTVHLGPVCTSPGVVDGAARRALADGGALAVDLESAALLAGVDGAPAAVVRAIVDTPSDPLLRPATVGNGVRALRSLRAAAPALVAWLDAVAPREVVLASPRSFCAGVGRAIDIVERGLQRFGAPVYVRRQVVHNAHVVRDLEQRGAVFVEEVEEVPEGSTVVLAAHGVAPSVRAEATRRNLRVVDATCPLVAKVHSEVRRYSARGDTVFLIGHAEHEEVVGTVGEAPERVVVVADAHDAALAEVPDPARVAYVMQTTLAVDEANQVANALRERFPTLSAPRRDDICYATTNRQQALRAIAAESDVVLVVGSANSSNSQRLVEVARRSGTPAHLVDDAGDVELAWLAGARRIGVTAGASAPPHLVTELVETLAGLGAVTVRENHVVDEDIHFTLPREVS